MKERRRSGIRPAFALVCTFCLVSALPAQEKLDRKFYNDYLDSLPNERLQQVELLERNLLRAAVRVIAREDSLGGPAFVRNLKTSSLKYEKVLPDTPFVRGIFHELPYLHPTPFMWIVQSGPYIVFVSFRVDPRRFIVEEYQTRAVKNSQKKEVEDPNHK